MAAAAPWVVFVFLLGIADTARCNSPPSAGPVVTSTFQDSPVIIPLNGSVSDPDNDTLSFFLVPANSVSGMFDTPVVNGDVGIDPVTGVAVFTPTPGVAGTGLDGGIFVYNVSDGVAFSHYAIVEVEINSVPQAHDDTFVGLFNTTLTGTATATDLLLAVVEYEVVTNPPPLSGIVMINTNTGEFTFFPMPGFAGATEFAFRARNSDGTWSDPGTIHVVLYNQTRSASQSMSKSASPSLSGAQTTTESQSHTQSPSQSPSDAETASPLPPQETQSASRPGFGSGGGTDKNGDGNAPIVTTIAVCVLGVALIIGVSIALLLGTR